MKKRLRIKKTILVMLMSLIVISVLSVAGYAAGSNQVGLMLLADTSDHFISAVDGTVEYTSEFTYGLSYTGATPIWLTGYYTVGSNTDRGNTAGGSIMLSVQEKNLFLWLNHSSKKAISNNIVIENIPTSVSYTIDTADSNKGLCAYTKGKTYRGRFEVSLICGANEAYNTNL